MVTSASGILRTLVLATLFLVASIFASRVGAPDNRASLTLVSTAMAQQAKPRKRKSLFRTIFGKRDAKKEVVKRKKTRKKRRASTRKRARKRVVKKRRSTKRSVRKASVAAPKAVVKLADARRVLVIGDFFAGGLADGLSARLSDAETVIVIDETKGLSGFVRDDIVNWPQVLPALLEEHKPHYVVAMVGSNDRQLIRAGGQKIKKRTPDWDAAYNKRVEALGTVLKASGLPYSWIGLPPVRFKSMNKDYLFFNELYGKAAASERGQFVDVWDGFSDADGNYSRSGPDVQGQIVLLRSKDGINLTRLGKRRLAYYVEPTIRKVLEGDLPTSVDISTAFDLESIAPKAAEYDPAKTGKTIVVRLNDPSADGAFALAGDRLDTKQQPAAAVPVPGGSPPSSAGARYGRVDNHAWPPSDAAPPSSATTVAGTN